MSTNPKFMPHQMLSAKHNHFKDKMGYGKGINCFISHTEEVKDREKQKDQQSLFLIGGGLSGV